MQYSALRERRFEVSNALWAVMRDPFLYPESAGIDLVADLTSPATSSPPIGTLNPLAIQATGQSGVFKLPRF